FALPQELAAGAVETEDGPARALAVDGLGEEHAVAPNDGRGVALGRQRGFPADVLGAAPREGSVRLRGAAVAGGAAPGGPVGGEGGAGTGQEEGQGAQGGKHA